jgi:hypothetical protein
MKLYKNGKVCDADPEQVDAMIAAGWSKEPLSENKPEPEPQLDFEDEDEG